MNEFNCAAFDIVSLLMSVMSCWQRLKEAEAVRSFVDVIKARLATYTLTHKMASVQILAQCRVKS